MRKLILLIFILYISNFIKAQNWCPPNAEWHFTRNFVAGSAYTKHTFTNTLTINSLQCQQINYYSERYSYLSNSVSSFTNTLYTHLNNNVVYLYNAVSNNFDTLFNYNAIIGNKWSLPNKTTTNCYKSRVLVIDTGHNYIQGVNLKWFKVTVNGYVGSGTAYSFNDTIYERMGCLNSYFYSPNDVCYTIADIEQGGPLRCYSDNQIPNYKRYWFSNSCNYYYNPTTQIKENINNIDFNIYPNPTYNFLNVEIVTHSGVARNNKIKIVNTLGQITQTTNIQNQKTILNISALQNGIYFLQVFDAEKLISTQKIIKE